MWGGRGKKKKEKLGREGGKKHENGRGKRSEEETVRDKGEGDMMR